MHITGRSNEAVAAARGEARARHGVCRLGLWGVDHGSIEDDVLEAQSITASFRVHSLVGGCPLSDCWTAEPENIDAHRLDFEAGDLSCVPGARC